MVLLATDVSQLRATDQCDARQANRVESLWLPRISSKLQQTDGAVCNLSSTIIKHSARLKGID